ncbi:acyl-CoA thioesterase [candidate division KSB1 bacterium]|nr:acyl-CoA thioesterase [candidate division KSB1 bacterium]
MPFEYKTRVRLHQTDAAGILFHSKIFELAFDAYAEFLHAHGVSVSAIIHTADYTMPYIHAEADYLAPLTVDDPVTIVMRVEKIGATSFTLTYDLSADGRLVGRVKTAHVTVSKETGQKIPLPDAIRRSLESALALP